MRRFDHLELAHVGRFAKLSVAFAGSQVGVLGPNGAGKSTVLSALYYAATGDLGRLGARSAAVNTCRPESDPAPYVRLAFTPEADSPDRAVVVRRLPLDGKEGSRRLTYGDRIWSAQADLTQVFERWAGLPLKAFGEFVFVPQGGLDLVVRAPAAKRAEILQRVFGVSHADRVYDVARERLLALPAPPDPAVMASLRVAAIDAARVAAEAEAAATSLPVPTPAQVGAWQAVLATHQRHEAAVAARAAAERVLATVVAGAPKPPDASEPAATDIGLAEKIRDQWVRRRKAESALADIAKLAGETTARLASAERALPPAPGPAPQPPRELLDGRRHHYVWSVLAVRPADSAEGVCPVCAGPLPCDTDAALRARTNLARLAALEAEFEAVEAAYRAAADDYAAAAKVADGLRAMAADLAGKHRRLREQLPPAPGIPEAEIARYLEGASGSRTAWAAYRSAQAAHARSLAAAQAAVASCVVPPAAAAGEVAEAIRALGLAKEASDAKTRLASRAQALREAADAASALVRDAEAREASAGAAGGWRARVEEVRAAYHRDAAPAAAVRQCLIGLGADLNRRLEHLAATFRVRVTPDGDLRADYHDGTTTRSVPADRLSGGEGCVLGLAWRLALIDRYAPKVGVLCLDEPTTGLDSARVSALRSALEAWRPHGGDRQFVIVTHERKLLSAFDSVVDLGAG